MLTDLEDAPAPPWLWSWKKILAWFLAIPTVFIIVILAYDAKLEPYDDLKSTRAKAPDARTNGYLMLKAAWENEPRPGSVTKRKWRQMDEGLRPWDDEVVAKLNPTRRDLRRELSQALEAPEWQVPLPVIVTLSEQVSVFAPEDEIFIMTAEAWQQARNGNTDSAAGLIRDLRRLSLRQLKGCARAADLRAAFFPNFWAAELTATLMAEVPPTDALLTRLAACWAEDQWTQADMAGPVAGESHYLSGYFQNGLYKNEYGIFDGVGRKLLDSFLTKPNATQNRINRVLKILQARGMESSPAMESSVIVEVQRIMPRHPEGIGWLNANLAGENLTRQFLSVPVPWITNYSRIYLFQERALRIVIALRRWQLNHSGAFPASLNELVPDYLPAIPSDPYDGRPLRWDAATQVIYAAGMDWKPDPPVFHPGQRTWLSTYDDNPGLRMAMPPPPPTPSAPKKRIK